MFGLFKKFKDGFAKTFTVIGEKTRGLFGGRKIDAASLGELEEALYTADFGVATTDEILREIKVAHQKDSSLAGQQAAAIGAAVLQRVLAGSERVIKPAAQAPTVIVLLGVNGS
jgi:fused signal recognition particle receptor